jgi:hypothetical protein
MSDEMDSELLEAARKIAARCGAIKLCGACGSTWTTDEVDPEDATSMIQLVRAAQRVVAEDNDLDRFEDDGGLKHALATAIAGAAPEKNCSH